MRLVDRAGDLTVLLHEHLGDNILRRILIVGALLCMRWILHSHQLSLFGRIDFTSV
jgi:hypothetical protein